MSHANLKDYSRELALACQCVGAADGRASSDTIVQISEEIFALGVGFAGVGPLVKALNESLLAVREKGAAACIAELTGRVPDLATQQHFMAAVARVVFADGRVSAAERQCYSEVAAAIGLPAGEAESILVAAEARPPS
jgi:tellurite resistance protein